MPRREDHEVRKGHVGHWIKKKTLPGYRQSSSACFCVWLSAVEYSSLSGRQMAQPY